MYSSLFSAMGRKNSEFGWIGSQTAICTNRFSNHIKLLSSIEIVQQNWFKIIWEYFMKWKKKVQVGIPIWQE
jgi:hypothetical protein